MGGRRKWPQPDGNRVEEKSPFFKCCLFYFCALSCGKLQLGKIFFVLETFVKFHDRVWGCWGDTPLGLRKNLQDLRDATESESDIFCCETVSADPLREKHNEKIIHFPTFSTTYIRESTIDEFFFLPPKVLRQMLLLDPPEEERRRWVGGQRRHVKHIQLTEEAGRTGGGGNFFSPSTFSFFPFG